VHNELFDEFRKELEIMFCLESNWKCTEYQTKLLVNEAKRHTSLTRKKIAKNTFFPILCLDQDLTSNGSRSLRQVTGSGSSLKPFQNWI
jgi:hypothetical protein